MDLHKEITLVDIRTYDCSVYDALHLSYLTQQHRGSPLEIEKLLNAPIQESSQIASEELLHGLKELTKPYKDQKGFPEISTSSEIQAPYLFYFHHRQYFHEAVRALPKGEQEAVMVWLQYISDRFGSTFSTLDKLFAQNMTPVNSLIYLFAADDIVVTREQEDYMAYKMNSLPRITHASSNQIGFELDVYNYAFDGNFQKCKTTRTVNIDDSPGEPPLGIIPIQWLSIYPLKYAEKEVEDQLRIRGEKLWSCRIRNFVSCSASDSIFSMQGSVGHIILLCFYAICLCWI